jgi:hypothetical protein
MAAMENELTAQYWNKEEFHAKAILSSEMQEMTYIQLEIVRYCTTSKIKAIKTSRHPFIAFEFQNINAKTYYYEKKVKFEEAVLSWLLPSCRLSCKLA